MAEHRYWRALGLEPYANTTRIALSEFWLMDRDTRVDQTASLTSSIAPEMGTLSSLSDFNTGTSVVISKRTVLVWDFGTPTAVNDVRLAAADSKTLFPRSLRIEWSDDGATWTPAFSAGGIQFPGERSFTASTDWIDPFSLDNLGAYTQFADTAGAWFVSAGSLQSTGATNQDVVSPNGIVLTDGYVETATTQARDGGLVLRLQDTNNYYLAALYDASNPVVPNEIRVYRRDAGTFYQIGAASVPMPVGTLQTYRFEAAGTTLRVLVNGTQVISLSDPVFASGRIGLRQHNEYNNTPSPIYRYLSSSAGGKRIAQDAPGTGTFLGTGVPAAAEQPAFQSISLLGTGRRALLDFRFDRNAKGRIVGTVKEKNTPANTPLARRVRVYRERDGMLVREGWSNAAGDYTFDGLEEQEAYTVLALDHTHHYRAVIADNLTLENGGVGLTQ